MREAKHITEYNTISQNCLFKNDQMKEKNYNKMKKQRFGNYSYSVTVITEE